MPTAESIVYLPQDPAAYTIEDLESLASEGLRQLAGEDALISDLVRLPDSVDDDGRKAAHFRAEVARAES